MSKKMKFNLTVLKVQSFVTELNSSGKREAKGGLRATFQPCESVVICSEGTCTLAPCSIEPKNCDYPDIQQVQ
jgi:hypothetical protein